MISNKMVDAMNKQINAEMYSAYLYLSMVAYFDSINLPGFSKWMKAQAQEEVFHAMKFFNHLSERAVRAKLSAIEAPQTEWKSPLNVFEDAYKHEQKVTGMINDLVTLARSENDHASDNFLQWYVKEQVEEEASADGVVQQLKLVGDNKGGLFMLDKELSTRVFNYAVATAPGGE
ncbi:MAG: ferritin [Pseudomonadota bacterium]